MSTDLKLVAGTLARDCYPTSAQALYNEMFELGAAQLGDITGIIISDTTPAATERDKAWIKTNVGAPVYAYAALWYNGHWIIRHPIEPSGNVRQIWVGSEADLVTYDGGVAGTVGDASGPMWEIDTVFAGRTPVGVGTIPDSNPARTVAVNGTTDSLGGTGTWLRTLTRSQLPAERLKLFADATQGEPVTDIGASDIVLRYSNPDSTSQAYRMAKADGYTNPTVGNTDQLGSGEAFVQAAPFYGIYIIKRTARKFIVVS